LSEPALYRSPGPHVEGGRLSLLPRRVDAFGFLVGIALIDEIGRQVVSPSQIFWDSRSRLKQGMAVPVMPFMIW